MTTNLKMKLLSLEVTTANHSKFLYLYTHSLYVHVSYIR